MFDPSGRENLFRPWIFRVTRGQLVPHCLRNEKPSKKFIQQIQSPDPAKGNQWGGIGDDDHSGLTCQSSKCFGIFQCVFHSIVRADLTSGELVLKRSHGKTGEFRRLSHREPIQAEQSDGEFQPDFFHRHPRTFEDLYRDFQRHRGVHEDTLVPEWSVFNLNSLREQTNPPIPRSPRDTRQRINYRNLLFQHFRTLSAEGPDSGRRSPLPLPEDGL